MQRRRTDVTGGIHEIFASVEVTWENTTSPSRLCVLLSQIPNFNMVSVAYSGEFVFPEFYLSDIDVSALSAAMSINTNKAEPLTPLVIGTPNAANEEDFRRTMLAMLLPQQVNVEVVFDYSKSKIYNGVLGLMCKMLFSTSPFFRSIHPVSARTVDAVIGDMLVVIGYTRDIRNAPLTVNGRGGGDIWQNVVTDELTGNGWINHGSEAAIPIPDPLYDGLGYLPSYAEQVVEANLLELDGVYVAEPPIFVQIISCLTQAKAQNVTAVKICALFEHLREKYQMFLINLNRHIYHYGETGFRLSDAARVDLERYYQTEQPQMDVLNSPVIVRVSSDSVGKYFLRVPTEFTISERIYKQPCGESVVSGDVQRVIVMLRVIRDWVIREEWNHRFPKRHDVSKVHTCICGWC